MKSTTTKPSTHHHGLPLLAPLTPSQRSRRPVDPANETADVVAQVLLPYGVGIDTHSKFIQVCVLVTVRKEVRRFERSFHTDWPDLKAAHDWVLNILKKHALAPAPADLRYCIESTSTYHLPVLLAWRGVPSVVNPLLAGPSHRKTDVLDARTLAHHSITGVWRPSFVPTEDAQTLRVLWAARSEAMRKATRSGNRINNIILRYGHTIGAVASMRTMHAQGLLQDLIEGRPVDSPVVNPDGLPPAARIIIQRLLADMQIALKDARRAETEALAFVKARDWPTGKDPLPGAKLLDLLLSVPGVGTATALSWLAEVTDPRRFNDPKQVAAYCGCDPSLKVSAGKVTSHTRRAGNERLHHALLFAAAGLLRQTEEPLGQWGRSIAGRHKKGGHRKACGAVARRIAVGLWHVHRKAEPFTYDGYTFTLKVIVPDLPLSTFLRPTAIKLLKANHLTTTQALADAYYAGRLGAIMGLGDTTIDTIRSWLIANAIRACPDQKPDESSAPHKESPSRSYPLSTAKVYTPRRASHKNEREG